MLATTSGSPREIRPQRARGATTRRVMNRKITGVASSTNSASLIIMM